MTNHATLLLGLIITAGLTGCGGPVTSQGTPAEPASGTSQAAAPANISLADFSGTVADGQATTTIELNDTPEDIDVIIIRVQYDPAVLALYKVGEAEQLLTSYGFIMTTQALQENGQTIQEIQFFTTTSQAYLPQGSSGRIIALVFDVLKDQDTTITLAQTSFDDSHPDWTKKNATFSGP